MVVCSNVARRPTIVRRVARLIALAVVVGATLAVPASASDLPSVSGVGERIDRYDVDIEIRSDGTLRVVETIDYNFGFASRRGIFRDVLVRGRFDPILQ